MRKNGFTVVELVVIIAVIAVLATVATIGMSRYSTSAADEQRSTNATAITDALENYYEKNGEYPGCDALTGSADSVSALLGGVNTEILVTPNATEGTFNSIQCGEGLAPTGENDIFVYQGDGSPGCAGSGACEEFVLVYWKAGDSVAVEKQSKKKIQPLVIADGSSMQTVTAENCPSSRTRVVDTRDNHTYWIQKLGDDCWMMTNLAYAGGGTNTYGDVKTVTDGSSGSPTYTTARYYIPSGSNATTEPTAPSTSTTGTGQYGYLYNWCAAMGVQTSTSACANATSPLPDTSVSICPAGWKLPDGGWGGHFGDLIASSNSGYNDDDTGLRANWLGQYGGGWGAFGFERVGSMGYYWASQQSNATIAFVMYHEDVTADADAGNLKTTAVAVRCVTN